MTTKQLLRATVAGLLLAAVAACGGGDSLGELSITGAWTRPTPEGSSLAAVYMNIASPVDDELLEVSSAVAANASIHASVAGDSDASAHDHAGHQHSGSGSEMSMTNTTLVLEADDVVALAPGGFHVMLEDLEAPLIEGETFELTLTFRQAGERRVVVEVATNQPE